MCNRSSLESFLVSARLARQVKRKRRLQVVIVEWQTDDLGSTEIAAGTCNTVRLRSRG